MANLIAPRYIAPDPQKTWLAAEQERASRDRTSLARQAETSRSVEAQQRLAQSGAQTAMNLQTQMQNMAIKADMHPLQMIEAQKRNQNLSLSNQAAAQQLILNEDKHELDQLQGIASLSASRIQTQINKSNLEEKIRQDGEAPIFSEKINLINKIIADPTTSLADLRAIDGTGLTGVNLVNYNRTYADAVDNKEAQEQRSAQGLARNAVAQQNAALIAFGATPDQLADPVERAKIVTARNAQIIDGFKNSTSVQSKMVDVNRYKDVNGWIDHAALQGAVQTANNMLVKMAKSDKPTQTQISGWISTRIKSLTDTNPDENVAGHLTASQIRTQAGKDVDSMVKKGRELAATARVTTPPDEVNTDPYDPADEPLDVSEFSTEDIVNMRNFAAATWLESPAQMGEWQDADFKGGNGEFGKNMLLKVGSNRDDWGFSPNSDDSAAAALSYLKENDIPIQESAAAEHPSKLKPGVVYWVADSQNNSETQVLTMFTMVPNDGNHGEPVAGIPVGGTKKPELVRHWIFGRPLKGEFRGADGGKTGSHADFANQLKRLN